MTNIVSMRMKSVLILFSLAVLLASCGAGRQAFKAGRKYSPGQLNRDYALFQDILEESHPGLYWYTSKDSMDYYFDYGRRQLTDSLTEPQFRKVLSYVIAKINCGHTVVKYSKKYTKYLDSIRTRSFPLSLKIWDDTAAVAVNLNRRDSIVKRGMVITKINNRNIGDIRDTLYQYISTDGYNLTHKNQVLSNRSGFGTAYTNLFGLSDKYQVEYSDSSGQKKTTVIPVYNPFTDTAGRGAARPRPRNPLPRSEQKKLLLQSLRSLRIDTAAGTAFMDVNTFQKGSKLRGFFKKSFRSLKQTGVKHLVIDVRGNGGGNVLYSTLLSRFIAQNRFKIADSLFTFTRSTKHGRYMQNHFFNRLFMFFVTRKKSDGNYHFGYFERHYFKPKKNNHFNGQVYILIGGNSFSATTLFTAAVIKQENVTVIGEETGGGAYGNSAWLIPDVTLPETKLRFRLPLFRLVIDKTVPKTGRGVQPEVESKPTTAAIRQGADYKMDKAVELIKNSSNNQANNFP